jgi:hypothetical protein
MRFVVKTYQEVCADLMIMLEDIEASLEEITKEAELSENQFVINETELSQSSNRSNH